MDIQVSIHLYLYTCIGVYSPIRGGYTSIQVFNTKFITMNILNVDISVYNGVKDTKGIIFNLYDFLLSCKHRDSIEKLRNEKDSVSRKEIKLSLPQACVSGIFDYPRSAATLKRHSGLICIDIDKQDNTHLTNFADVKKELSKANEVAYISKSVSGNGYFAIIPLLYPEYHKQQFEQLKRSFWERGLVVDQACGNVDRMRCISYDEEPYFNLSAKKYSGLYIEPKRSFTRYIGDDHTIEDVDYCCEVIQTTGIDITEGYHNWFIVCASLASLGEQGRQYFHICSQQNSKYKFEESDKKFNNALQKVFSIGIGSFFKLCRENGIYFKDKIRRDKCY